MAQKFQTELAQYIPKLLEGIAPFNPPKFQYKSGGCYSYYEARLKSVLHYKDLKPVVFRCLKEVGNALALVHIVDVTMVCATYMSSDQATVPYLCL